MTSDYGKNHLGPPVYDPPRGDEGMPRTMGSGTVTDWRRLRNDATGQRRSDATHAHFAGEDVDALADKARDIAKTKGVDSPEYQKAKADYNAAREKAGAAGTDHEWRQKAGGYESAKQHFSRPIEQEEQANAARAREEALKLRAGDRKRELEQAQDLAGQGRHEVASVLFQKHGIDYHETGSRPSEAKPSDQELERKSRLANARNTRARRKAGKAEAAALSGGGSAADRAIKEFMATEDTDEGNDPEGAAERIAAKHGLSTDQFHDALNREHGYNAAKSGSAAAQVSPEVAGRTAQLRTEFATQFRHTPESKGGPNAAQRKLTDAANDAMLVEIAARELHGVKSPEYKQARAAHYAARMREGTTTSGKEPVVHPDGMIRMLTGMKPPPKVRATKPKTASGPGRGTRGVSRAQSIASSKRFPGSTRASESERPNKGDRPKPFRRQKDAAELASARANRAETAARRKRERAEAGLPPKTRRRRDEADVLPWMRQLGAALSAAQLIESSGRQRTRMRLDATHAHYAGEDIDAADEHDNPAPLAQREKSFDHDIGKAKPEHLEALARVHESDIRDAVKQGNSELALSLRDRLRKIHAELKSRYMKEAVDNPRSEKGAKAVEALQKLAAKTGERGPVTGAEMESRRASELALRGKALLAAAAAEGRTKPEDLTDEEWSYHPGNEDSHDDAMRSKAIAAKPRAPSPDPRNWSGPDPRDVEQNIYTAERRRLIGEGKSVDEAHRAANEAVRNHWKRKDSAEPWINELGRALRVDMALRLDAMVLEGGDGEDEELDDDLAANRGQRNPPQPVAPPPGGDTGATPPPAEPTTPGDDGEEEKEPEEERTDAWIGELAEALRADGPPDWVRKKIKRETNGVPNLEHVDGECDECGGDDGEHEDNCSMRTDSVSLYISPEKRKKMHKEWLASQRRGMRTIGGGEDIEFDPDGEEGEDEDDIEERMEREDAGLRRDATHAHYAGEEVDGEGTSSAAHEAAADEVERLASTTDPRRVQAAYRDAKTTFNRIPEGEHRERAREALTKLAKLVGKEPPYRSPSPAKIAKMRENFKIEADRRAGAKAGVGGHGPFSSLTELRASRPGKPVPKVKREDATHAHFAGEFEGVSDDELGARLHGLRQEQGDVKSERQYDSYGSDRESKYEKELMAERKKLSAEIKRRGLDKKVLLEKTKGKTAAHPMVTPAALKGQIEMLKGIKERDFDQASHSVRSAVLGALQRAEKSGDAAEAERLNKAIGHIERIIDRRMGIRGDATHAHFAGEEVDVEGELKAAREAERKSATSAGAVIGSKTSVRAKAKVEAVKALGGKLEATMPQTAMKLYAKISADLEGDDATRGHWTKDEIRSEAVRLARSLHSKRSDALGDSEMARAEAGRFSTYRSSDSPTGARMMRGHEHVHMGLAKRGIKLGCVACDKRGAKLGRVTYIGPRGRTVKVQTPRGSVAMAASEIRRGEEDMPS